VAGIVVDAGMVGSDMVRAVERARAKAERDED